MSKLITESFDGRKLSFTKELAKKVKAFSIIVHGGMGHKGQYDDLANALLENDIGVLRYDARGHGETEGKRMYIEDYEDCVKDLKHFVDMLKSEYPLIPIFLLGHSFGGFTVAHYGIRYPGSVNGFITSGAGLRVVKKNKDMFSSEGLPLDTPMPIPQDYMLEGLYSDEKRREMYANDPDILRIQTVAFYKTFNEGLVWLEDNCKDFVDPILVTHGADDLLIPEFNSREFFAGISSKDKGLIIYPFLRHEIWDEPSRNQDIFSEVNSWINRHL
jgi:lysophospholipase